MPDPAPPPARSLPPTPSATAEDAAARIHAERAALADAPAPEVTAIFLRPATAPVEESLVDAITTRVMEALEGQVRASVTAAVLALAPRLVVSLPGGADAGGDAQVRARPKRGVRRHD